MDVSHEPHDIAAHFGRPVDDLRRLLAFHGLRSGAPQHLAAFARKLEDSKPFRTDFTALLRSTRDLEHGRLTSDEMLAIVAIAIGGEALLDDPAASPVTTHTITLVLMLLAGIGGWSDTGTRTATTGEPRASVPHPDPRDQAPPLRPRFAAAAQTPPPETPAVDVRAFVRSDARSDARPAIHPEPWPEAWTEQFETRPEPFEAPTELSSATHAPAQQPEPRSEAPHILRREPLSEIVRTSTPQATPPRPPSAPDRVPTPSQIISDPTFAHSATLHTTVFETPLSPAAPPRPAPQQPAPRLQPAPQPKPAPHTEPEPYPAPESQPRPAAAWRSPAHAAPARNVGGTPAPAQATATESPSADLDDRETEPPSLSSADRRHPTSRKPTLNAILATAAVGLLAFGIFEGLHSRTAPPSQTPTRTTAAQPTRPATPTPAPPAAPETAGLIPAEPSPATSTPTPALTPEPTRKASIAPTPTPEDLPPATPSPSRSASPVPRPKPEAPPTLTRTAGLQPPPHGRVAVPESTMNRQLLATKKPVYPPSALAQEIGGTVVLRAFISADGAIRRTDVVSGPPPLVNSALAAASWRRYRPFLVGGRPVEVQTEITYHYVAP